MLLVQNLVECEYEMNIFMRLFFDKDEDVEVFTDVSYEDEIINAYCQINYRYEVYFGEFHLKYILSNDEKTDKRYFSIACTRAFVDGAQKIKKIDLPWGVMCGVRPAKSVTSFHNKDKKSYEEIKEHLKEAYGVKDNKCDLAIEVAKNEEKILSSVSDDSVSIYIGIPFCPSRCLYCSFVSTDINISGKYMDDFTRCLQKEIKKSSEIVKKLGLKVENIYIGGGTPTTLSGENLDLMLDNLTSSFDLSYLNEFTLEAGRPDTVTKEKLEIAKKYGVDRISINPQTTNDETLKRIGRKHNTKMFYEAFDIAKRVGFKVINTDVIAGLVGEDEKIFKKTIDDLVKISPENITIHSMAIKRAASFRFSNNDLTASAIMNKMLSYGQEKLLEQGYLPYYMYRQKNISGNLENVGYAKDGKFSFYNVNIMEEAQTIIALGGGSTSKIVTKKGITRVANYKDPLEYIKNFDEILKRKDEIYNLLYQDKRGEK